MRVFLYLVSIHVATKKGSFFEMNEMIECKWDRCPSLSLALRFCCLVLAVVAFRRGSALLLRLFRLWFVTRPFLLTRFLFASAALLLRPLPVAITPLAIVRLIFATPLALLILGLVRIFGLGWSRFGFGTWTSGSGLGTFTMRPRATTTSRWPLLALLWPWGRSAWSRKIMIYYNDSENWQEDEKSFNRTSSAVIYCANDGGCASCCVVAMPSCAGDPWIESV